MNPDLPRLHGRFEYLSYEQDRLLGVGWMFRPGLALDELRVFLEGRFLGRAQPENRQDIETTFRALEAPPNAGFSFELPVPPGQVEGLRRLEVVGHVSGQPIGRLVTAFVPDFAANLPVPPEDLMLRVTRERNAMTYLCSGLELLESLRTAFRRHHHAPRQVLDWGCGAGRLSALLLTHCKPEALAGCDIVEENVAWCTERWPGADFRTCDLHPPLPWPDGSFDTVVGNSVLTHLERSDQVRWLAELRRVLRPGGLAFVTVHGEFAAAHSPGGDTASALAEVGILDHFPDPILDGLIPAGYYRAVFQSEDYTRRTFSRELEVVEYRSGAMGHYQDLVVLRRP